MAVGTNLLFEKSSFEESLFDTPVKNLINPENSTMPTSSDSFESSNKSGKAKIGSFQIFLPN